MENDLDPIAAKSGEPIQPLIAPGLDILNESWEIFKKSWKKLFGLMVLIPIISSLIAIAAGIIVLLIFLIIFWSTGHPAIAATAAAALHQIASTTGSFVYGASLIGNLISNPLTVILILIEFLIFIILVLVPFIIGFYSTIFVLREPEIKVWEAFKKGLKFFWRYLWMIIILLVVTLAGYVLFIIPGIIFSIWFTFAMYILLVENVGGAKALGRSRELVKGFWWTVFARLLIIAIFSFIISLALNILNQFSGSILALGDRQQQLSLVIIGVILAFVIAIVSLLANFIVYAVIIIYKYLLYGKLKQAKQQNPQAADQMSGGKKFGLSLVIVIPLIIAILFLSLIAMVGIGSFVKSQLGDNASVINSGAIGNDALPASDDSIFNESASTSNIEATLTPTRK